MNGYMMKPMDRMNVPRMRRLTAQVRCEVTFLSFFIFVCPLSIFLLIIMFRVFVIFL